MRIAFMGASGTGKSTLANWLVGPEGPEATRGLPICPVGSRGTAKAMGFVGLDGEGRPYDVDAADEGLYLAALADGASSQVAAERAKAGFPGRSGPMRSALMGATGTSCRPLFQRKLAEDKIAWETEPTTPPPTNLDADWKRQIHNSIHSRSFVTDRTPLDDAAYAILHCREVVTEEFLRRAFAHTASYDLIVFCPLDAFSATAGDPARVADRQYHLHYEVILYGLILKAGVSWPSPSLWTLGTPDLESRKRILMGALGERA